MTHKGPCGKIIARMRLTRRGAFQWLVIACLLSATSVAPAQADLPFCITDAGEQGRKLEDMGCVPALATHLQILSHELIDEIRVFRKTEHIHIFHRDGQPLDLRQLSKLPLLHRVTFGGDPLTNLDGLDTLTTLSALSINIDTTDLSPLAGLTNLRAIGLEAHSDVNMSVFSGHPLLSEITVDARGDSLVTLDLEDLPELQQLVVRAQHVQIGRTRNLPKLYWMWFQENAQHLDFSEVAGIPRLQEVYVEAQSVTGVESLGASRVLRHLKLYGVPIRDFGFVEGVKQLQTLKLDRIVARDLGGLAALTNPNSLHLGGLDLDYSSLPPFENLGSLRLTGGAIDDLSVLSMYDDLIYLSLQDMRLGDLAQLPQIATVKQLNLKGSTVDLAPLNRFENLEHLILPDETVLKSRRQIETYLSERPVE